MKNKTSVAPVGVIDIGSNTVLLTAGRMGPKGELEVVLECHGVARLAQNLQDGKNLDPAAKQRVLAILQDFQEQAQQAGISQLRAAGTAAFRRAADGPAFAKEIAARYKIPTRILSGNEEAHYSFLSAQKDLKTSRLGMIDIGGGSTELVFGSEDQWRSLPLGTVRLYETMITKQPIEDAQWQAMLAQIRNILEEDIPQNLLAPLLWVAVAATPTTLASVMKQLPHYDPAEVHGFLLKRDSLQELVERLRRLNILDRQKVPGMIPERAELLPLGGAILWQTMEFLGIDEIRASHHGLRYGLLWEELESQANTNE